MSGQPNNFPTDASKFRQNYLANLALQANINDMNLQANKIYQKTGQTPTTLTDTRTSEEKLADLERLKIEIRAELSQIADGANANSIVQQLSAEQLQFLGNNIGEVVKIIKPKYATGIPADVFIGWLDSYMENANKNYGIDLGLQQGQGQDIIAGIQQLKQIADQKQLKQLIGQLRGDVGLMNEQLLREIEQTAQALVNILPSRELMTAIAQIQDLNTQAVVSQYTGQIIQGMPSAQSLNTLLRQLQVATLQKDKQRINMIGEQILQEIAQSPQTKEQMRMIYNLVSREVGGLENPFEAPPQTALSSPRVETPRVKSASLAEERQRLKAESELQRKQDKFDALTELADTALGADTAVAMNDFINAIQKFKIPNTTRTDLGVKDKRPTNKQHRSLYQDAFTEAQLAVSEYLDNLKAEIKAGIPSKEGGAPVSPAVAPPVVVKKIQRPKKQPVGGAEVGGAQSAEGRGIKGRGLKRVKPITIDRTRGIMPQKTYSQLGKYYISNPKLNQNIISIRRENGHSAKIPVKRVSSNLGDVVRTIVGGGVPNYSHLDKLSDDEKHYLYKITKQTNIIDKLTIPTPNKAELDKNINEFEIMKGEIMNGNDNVEYIKKFKLLIVKLINKDLLPKNEGKEILMELASLGY